MVNYDIIWNCRCIPNFVASYEVPEYFTFIPFCTGTNLQCANTRAKSLGMEKIIEENDVIMPEALMSPNKIGNISKPTSIDCLPSCKVYIIRLALVVLEKKQDFLLFSTF